MEGFGNGFRGRVTLALCGATTLLLLLLVSGCRRAAPSPDEYRVSRATADAASLFAAEPGAWQRSQRISWGPAPYATVFRAVWNDIGLFVRFDAADSDPWHTLTDHDAKLWDEEVVEIFLQPDARAPEYGEIEMSPGNVSCDVWVNPGTRRFDLSWNLEGLGTRVIVQRDAGGRVTGWIAVGLLPWRGFASAATGATLPPRAGDQWRFNVFRIERPGGRAAPKRDALFLAWSPMGKTTFHVPEAFRAMVFLRDAGQ
jgi:hypothetical protein